VVLHLGCLGLALSPAGVGAQPLDKAGQKCVNAGNKGLEKLMKTQGKLNASCAKNGATGKLATTIETCLTADAGGRVAKAQAANEAKVAKACVGAPAFGSADPTGAATGPIAVSAELALAHAIFGPDLDAAVVQKGLDPAGSACQATVVKLAQKCQDAKLKAFNQCKKTALKGSSSVPAVASAQALQDACLGSGTSPLPDPKGKTA
jgi:hypothetical protein